MTDIENEQNEVVDLISLTADIVSAYVARNSIPVSELSSLLTSVHGALAGLGQPIQGKPEKLTPPVPIRKTVTPDHIISLEDGKPYRILTRHLTRMGLTPEQYRQKWGLPKDYPMVSEKSFATRSSIAKSTGLGQMRTGRSKKAAG